MKNSIYIGLVGLFTINLFAVVPSDAVYWKALGEAVESKDWEGTLTAYISNFDELELWQAYDSSLRSRMRKNISEGGATEVLPNVCFTSDDTLSDWISYQMMLGQDNYELFSALDAENMGRLVRSNPEHYCPGWLNMHSEGFIYYALNNLEEIFSTEKTSEL